MCHSLSSGCVSQRLPQWRKKCINIPVFILVLDDLHKPVTVTMKSILLTSKLQYNYHWLSQQKYCFGRLNCLTLNLMVVPATNRPQQMLDSQAQGKDVVLTWAPAGSTSFPPFVHISSPPLLTSALKLVLSQRLFPCRYVFPLTLT